jgi:hypothetical protein
MFTSPAFIANPPRKMIKKKISLSARHGGGCDEPPSCTLNFSLCFLMKHLIKCRKERKASFAVALAADNPGLSQPRVRVVWCVCESARQPKPDE